MKRFLSILLALAVGFTFTFGSAMSAFAADYSVSTARPELDTVVKEYSDMVSVAKGLVVGAFTYDKETGLCKETGLTKYDKNAVEAAANAVEAAANKALVVAEEAQLALINTAGTVNSLDIYIKAIAKAVTEYGTADNNLTTTAGFLAALKADTLTLEKSFEATQYEAVKTAIAKDFPISDYPNEGTFKDKTGTIKGTYTAQEVVANALKAADKAIADAKKVVTDAEAAETAVVNTYTTAATEYVKVYNSATKIGTIVTYIANFTIDGEADGTPVRTNAKIAEDKAAADKATETALETMKLYAIGDFYTGYKNNFAQLYTDIKAVDTEKKVLYVEDTTANSKKATVLGVEVADRTSATTVTETEQKAIISALYAKINSTLAIAAKAAAAGTDVKTLYSTTDSKVFLKTIKNAEVIADKYDEVVTYANGLKTEYVFGEKKYDNAKIDKVMAVAEDVVYKDLGAATLKKAADYFLDAVKVVYPAATDLTVLKADADATIKAKFKKAQADAKKLFDGTIITSGADATPEAEKVYKAELYVDNSKAENGKTYAQIVATAKAAIDSAETYEEIDEALAVARISLGQLMLDADENDVIAARTSYVNALNSYVEQQKAIMGADYREDSFANIKTDGAKKINDANTVAAVKAAYDAAVASVSAIMKSTDIKAVEDSVKEQIKALPYSTQITLADKATVEAAREAYDDLTAVYGSDAFGKEEPKNSYAKLGEAEAAIEKLESEALAKKVEETAKKINAIQSAATDAGAEAAVALKAEVTTLIDDVEAFNENAATENKIALNAGNGETVSDFVVTIRGAEEYLVLKAVRTLPDVITKDDAAAVKAVRDAFEALTDKQQGEIEDVVVPALEKAEASLEALEVVTPADAKAFLQDAVIKASSTVKNGKVTVTANADVQYLIDNGFTVEFKFYKSTKKSSGYKATVTKNAADSKTYTNTNPVKGANYYKYIIIVTDAEGNVVTKTALKECAYAKRTIK